jgi:hypothetical protein
VSGWVRMQNEFVLRGDVVCVVSRWQTKDVGR